jgi:dTDP-4-dehydrorhamnose reductase
VRAFYDRTVSPSFVDHVSAATRRLIEHESPFGLYHCVNSGFTTWYELALELARRLRKDAAAIVPVSAEGSGLKAPRPKFCALSNALLASLGIEMPTWQTAVEHYAVSRGRSGITPA